LEHHHTLARYYTDADAAAAADHMPLADLDSPTKNQRIGLRLRKDILGSREQAAHTADHTDLVLVLVEEEASTAAAGMDTSAFDLSALSLALECE
jgi:hypothetical protein